MNDAGWIPVDRFDRITPTDGPRRDVLIEAARAIQCQRIRGLCVDVAIVTRNDVDIQVEGVNINERRLRGGSAVAIGERKADAELTGGCIIVTPLDLAGDR